MAHFFVWAPFILMLLAGVRLLLGAIMGTVWSARDLPIFLRRVDLSLLETLLDPMEEARLREEMSAGAFRKAQRQRIRGACEQIRRVSHNAGILLKWATLEFKKIEQKRRGAFEEHDRLIVSVIEAATHAKRSAAWALVKIGLWRAAMMPIWPFLPSPSLSDFREVNGRDLLEDCESLNSLAGQLLLDAGGDHYDQARASL